MIPPIFSIGFELEFEGIGYIENFRLLNSLLGAFGKIVPDDSLNNGFEISSSVSLSNLFKGSFPLREWELLFQRLCKIPIQVGENTGMHVHVGRSGLTAEILQKINFFVFSQYPLFSLIGEREPTEHCFFQSNSIKEISALGGRGYKYRFFNVLPPETVEFRFFKSTKTLHKFLCNMQFIVALIEFIGGDFNSCDEFVDACFSEDQDLAKNFIDFIREGNFGFLNSFLNKNKNKLPNLLGGRVLKPSLLNNKPRKQRKKFKSGQKVLALI